ncbi:hypothetical protein ONE63_011190 [Megalurothrips usitatus]|uniref:Integrase catalytic domain-containing protein n=1 Tax=Megalurothrips usitatus TaxID=439358 RepID=A0AAV7WZZ1_9NEOP|nr:hypothetical protein ONE63_011190 [Megalurothrips usitatus]
MSKGINLQIPSTLEIICSVCAEAKQHKRPHNTTRTRATKPLQIVHTDVCGPIDPETYNNKRYYVTFIDDYTNYCTVYVIQFKSEVYEVLKQYVLESENYQQRKVYKIRCDNGGEYISTDLKSWCKRKGIVLDYTVPRCPQLNGKAEKMNRSLLDIVRAMLFQSGMNNNMWGEAVQTAAYLKNRSPTTAVPKLPAQMWTGKTVNLSNIQTFGTIVFSKNNSQLKKLQSRSKQAILVGYTSNSYKLWDPQEKEIFVSRDVVFTDLLYHQYKKPQPNNSIIKFKGSTPHDQPLDHNIENPQHVPEQTNEDEPMDIDPPENQIQNQYQEAEDINEVTYPVNNPKTYNLRKRENIKPPSRLKDYEVYFCPNEETPLPYDQCIKDPKWKSAIKLIKSGQMNRKSKHITVKYYYITVAMDEGVFQPIYINTDEQPADIFTKPLKNIKFKKFRDMLCKNNSQ